MRAVLRGQSWGGMASRNISLPFRIIEFNHFGGTVTLLDFEIALHCVDFTSVGLLEETLGFKLVSELFCELVMRARSK
ncbi:hypothetical protein JTE90_015709 [Oedothorax gibbosus]|uniref:Uncharacterized protein n=1 Tax=Oedothorax gibbosus TaxID=931172 RepID=A0AAV6UKT8_9ARAC|nr:hypothetical protein JTE90_015709 [Oedothorax gibbosus]